MISFRALLFSATLSAACLAGCGEKKVQCPLPTVPISVCDPGAGPYTLNIDNRYFPLPVGHHLVLEGEDDGEQLRVEITVLDATEVVAGVTTRVVEEAEYENDRVAEISLNYFAQAPDGTVCYFGEDVDIYEGGEVVSHHGAWRAGENGFVPGIMMPANPEPGQAFFQEGAPGVAEDMSEIMSLDETITVPAGSFNDAMRTRDCNALDNDVDTKYYLPGIGIAIDGPARLTSY